MNVIFLSSFLQYVLNKVLHSSILCATLKMTIIVLYCTYSILTTKILDKFGTFACHVIFNKIFTLASIIAQLSMVWIMNTVIGINLKIQKILNMKYIHMKEMFIFRLRKYWCIGHSPLETKYYLCTFSWRILFFSTPHCCT
jgi:hypothetical protein